MSDTPDTTVKAAQPKSGKMPVMLGLALSLPALAAGFWLTWSGMIPFGGGQAAGSPAAVSYIELDPLIVALNPGSRSRHLRLTAHLEVEPGARAAVENLRPRILDMMNSYLSALTLGELEAQSSMIRLRAHLLRRIALIAGEGQVRDLLITEFVLN
ncbi:flagellar basal body-associated FliL family protein [Falsigemmobacter faecalis]|uniref:Flagellar protein FliL n=1 Tax=Falsigemmobacter faecalis TaxID=2488730 RepID=A0A3P3DJ43_9RHOB|nr:flagellar basal body-associated FliL family protein [Falsigemmobacter faecalis]RRH74281.1 flagellar basal body-associated FliL family protein [Falsigemmobacter faecalis]